MQGLWVILFEKVTWQMHPYFLDKYIGGFRLKNDNSQDYITM